MWPGPCGKAACRSICRFTVPECNSLGLAHDGGQAIDDALQARADAGQADTVIILENDLYHQFDAASADALLAWRGASDRAGSSGNATTEKAGDLAARGDLRRDGRHAGQ